MPLCVHFRNMEGLRASDDMPRRTCSYPLWLVLNATVAGTGKPQHTQLLMRCTAIMCVDFCQDKYIEEVLCDGC